MRRFRTKRDDPLGRFKAGEIGTLDETSPPWKYDLWLDFGTVELPEGTTLFGKPIQRIKREFGFWADEVEEVLD